MAEKRAELSELEIFEVSEKHKYEKAKPEGILLVLFCIFSVILLMFVQNGLFPGTGPNLLLVITVLLSVKCRPPKAILLGVLTGLALDIFYGRYIGLYALLFMYVAFVCCMVSENQEVGRGKVILGAVPVFLAFAIAESLAARLLARFLSGGTVLYTSFMTHFLQRIVPSVIMNELALAVLIWPVYIIWRRLSPH